MKFENSAHLKNISEIGLFFISSSTRDPRIQVSISCSSWSLNCRGSRTPWWCWNGETWKKSNLSKTCQIKSKQMWWFSTQYFSTSTPESWSIFVRTSTERSNSSCRLSCSKSSVYKHNQILIFWETQQEGMRSKVGRKSKQIDRYLNLV
jgi:hypothetical protein